MPDGQLWLILGDRPVHCWPRGGAHVAWLAGLRGAVLCPPCLLARSLLLTVLRAMWDLSSSTRGGTPAPCIGSTES